MIPMKILLRTLSTRTTQVFNNLLSLHFCHREKQIFGAAEGPLTPTCHALGYATKTWLSMTWMLMRQ